MKKTQKKLSFFMRSILVLLSAAIALSIIGCAKKNVSEEETTVKMVTFTVEVHYEKSGERIIEVTTDKKTVGEALIAKGVIEGEEGPYGLVVKTVSGETHDSGVENKYWAFYVNGQYATAGVDKTEVEEGAVYAFKVETF